MPPDPIPLSSAIPRDTSRKESSQEGVGVNFPRLGSWPSCDGSGLRSERACCCHSRRVTWTVTMPPQHRHGKKKKRQVLDKKFCTIASAGRKEPGSCAKWNLLSSYIPFVSLSFRYVFLFFSFPFLLIDEVVGIMPPCDFSVNFIQYLFEARQLKEGKMSVYTRIIPTSRS